MEESTKPIKVTELGQLEDENLVPELQKRLKFRRLTFITSKDCRKRIYALRLKPNPLSNKKELDPNIISPLWRQLIDNAVTYLKMSDSREWVEEYNKPRSIEERSSLKAFGVERLTDYFVQFKKFESILYGAVDYYHEHTLHVFRVWMLGALLLDDLLQDGKCPSIEFFDYVKDKTDKEIGELILPQEIQAMWCIIALSHDLGYPLQKVDNINTETREMLRGYAKVNLQDLNFDVPQQHQFINDFILKFISSRTVFKDEWTNKSKERLKPEQKNKLRKIVEESKERVFRTHVQSKYYLKYSKSLEDFQHGIFSSILLMKSLTYFLESDFDMDELKPLDYKDAKQCAIRREILRAIAGHTCEEIYHIRPDTLGFMLILCDELQSWGRPTFEEMLYSTRTLPIARLNNFSSKEVNYELELPGSEKELNSRTKGLFRRLHKMLRVAVDTPRRECTCQVTVKSKQGLLHKYEFEFKSGDKKPPTFRFEKDGQPWPLWEESDASPSEGKI